MSTGSTKHLFRASVVTPHIIPRQESLAVLAMEYIGRVNQAAVSCADGFLTIWDLETFKLLRYVRLRDVQVGLRFCPSMGVLTSWGVDEFNHEIIVWDVDKLTVLHVLDGHSEAVKDTCEVAPANRADGLVVVEKPWEPMLGELSATKYLENTTIYCVVDDCKLCPNKLGMI